MIYTCPLCDASFQLGYDLTGPFADSVMRLHTLPTHGPPGRPCPASGLRPARVRSEQPEPMRLRLGEGVPPRGGSVGPAGQGPM